MSGWRSFRSWLTGEIGLATVPTHRGNHWGGSRQGRERGAPRASARRQRRVTGENTRLSTLVSEAIEGGAGQSFAAGGWWAR